MKHRLMKKLVAAITVITMSGTILAGCSGGGTEETGGDSDSDNSSQSESGREEITMWFWGASDEQREAMDTYLIQAFHDSQDEYELVVEYRADPDNDIAVAVSAGEGPDIVYGSGPAFVAGYAAEGLFIDLDDYAEQYGWKDRILEPCYEICTIDGKLYSIPGGLTTTGAFYNKKVLEENGWSVPETYEELTAIMDEARELGLYGGLSGAKDWRYVNEMYVGMMLTHVAGPEVMHKVLSGEQKWNSPEVAKAAEELARWYENGYLAGDDYWNLDFSEAAMMLAEEQSPFFFGALNVFQFIKNMATEEQCDNIGFIPIPDYDGGAADTVSLGAVCSFSINASCTSPDAAAMVLDLMLSTDFSAGISTVWPGYWGMPIRELADVDLDSYEGIYREYLATCMSVVDALDQGNFAYAAATCFPAATYEACIDIDSVWFEEMTIEEYLDNLDAAYAEDVEAGALATIPKPEY